VILKIDSSHCFRIRAIGIGWAHKQDDFTVSADSGHSLPSRLSPYIYMGLDCCKDWVISSGRSESMMSPQNILCIFSKVLKYVCKPLFLVVF
jgi:hypothetical protein